MCNLDVFDFVESQAVSILNLCQDNHPAADVSYLPHESDICFGKDLNKTIPQNVGLFL